MSSAKNISLRAEIEQVRQNNATKRELDWDCKEAGDEIIIELASSLGTNTYITKIDLSVNQITNKGAKAIGKALETNTVITEIDLSGNQISHEGAEAIAKALETNNNIKRIYLNINQISNQGGKAIAKALERNTCIAEIYLGSNQISDEGGKAIAKALESNTNITKIDLSYNQINDEGATAIIKALESNTSVNKIYLKDNNINSAFMEQVNTFLAYNRVLKEDIENITAIKCRDTFLLSKYIKGYSFTQRNTDSKIIEWNWTEMAWEAATDDTSGKLIFFSKLIDKEMKKGCDKRVLKSFIMRNINDGEGSNKRTTLLHKSAEHTNPLILPWLKMCIEELKVPIDAINEKGRTIREIATENENNEISEWAKKHGTFLGRYIIDGGMGLDSPPVHDSERCTVYYATDVEKSLNDEKYYVAIKIVKNMDIFQTELNARLSVDSSTIQSDKDIPEGANMYDKNHVIPLYRHHDFLDGKNKVQRHCLILAKGAKSLHQIIDSEMIAGKDIDKIRCYGKGIAKAILHMHEKKNFIHCDIKPRNIIRTPAGDIKLIDLSVAVQIGEDLSSKSKSTAYISPEIAKIEFYENETENKNELSKQLKEKKVERFRLEKDNIYNEQYDKLFSEIKMLGRRIKMLENGNESEHETSIKANNMIDIWSFGVTMYYLCTNRKHLFISINQTDDTLDGNDDKSRLQNWQGLTPADLNKILPGCKDRAMKRRAVDFFKKCLNKDKDARFQDIRKLMAHPFFAGGDIKEIKEEIIANRKEITMNRKEIVANNGNIIENNGNIIENKTEIKNLRSKIEMVSTKLHKLHKQLNGFQEATTRIVKELTQSPLCAPKLMLFVPQHKCHFKGKNTSGWFKKKVKVVFVCPVTMRIQKKNDGSNCSYNVKLPKDWVSQYGPVFLMSLNVIQLFCSVGKAFESPPQGIGCDVISMAKNTINSFKDSVSVFQEMYEELMKHEELKPVSDWINDAVKDISAPRKLLGTTLKNFKTQGGKDVSKLFNPKDDNFIRSGLVLATDMNGVTEYVHKDIKMVYEEVGFEKCLKMSQVELQEMTIGLMEDTKKQKKEHDKIFRKAKETDDNALVLAKGYLEKKGVNVLSGYEQRYFVLYGDGSLAYYKTKDPKNSDHCSNNVLGKCKAGLFDIQKGDRGRNHMIFTFKNSKSESLSPIKLTFRTISNSEGTNNDTRQAWIDAATKLLIRRSQEEPL